MKFNLYKFEKDITNGSSLYAKWNPQFRDDLVDIGWGLPHGNMEHTAHEFVKSCKEPGKKKHRFVRVICPNDGSPIHIQMGKNASVELCEIFADHCLNLILLLHRYGLIQGKHV